MPIAKTTFFVIKNRFANIKYKKLEFRDSYLILPVPLAAYEKKTIDIKKFEKGEREKHQYEIEEYLESDCKYLYALVTRFIGSYGNGLTLRNRSFDQMHKRGYKIPSTSRIFDDKGRKYFFGGRTECFAKGIIEKELKIYDIKSAYPWAMLSEHAWGDTFKVSSKLPKEKIEQCFITIECDSKGAFPFRGKTNEVTFPHQRAIYHVTGWEYMAAGRLGLISNARIHEVLIPDTTTDFKKFVDDFYELKLDAEKRGDKETRLFAKLLMNSGYGGFAMDSANFKEYTWTEIGKHPGKEWQLKFENEKYSIWEKPNPTYEYFNVLTSASITGKVRSYLLESFSKCKGVKYCDTDSIICEHAELQMGDALGNWDLEARGNFLALAGKKLYAFKKQEGEWKLASKGVKLTPEQIISVAKGNKEVDLRDAPVFSIKKGIYFLEREIQNTVKLSCENNFEE